MSATTDTTPKTKGGWWALSPLAVFLCLYLVTSLLVNDFYKVPITVAFLTSSCYAIAITRGLNLEQRIYQFSVGASNKNIMLMYGYSSLQEHSPKAPSRWAPLMRP